MCESTRSKATVISYPKNKVGMAGDFNKDFKYWSQSGRKVRTFLLP